METYPVKFIGKVGGLGDFGVQRGFLTGLTINPVYYSMYTCYVCLVVCPVHAMRIYPNLMNVVLGCISASTSCTSQHSRHAVVSMSGSQADPPRGWIRVVLYLAVRTVSNAALSFFWTKGSVSANCSDPFNTARWIY